jgi:hypothetical protein
VTAGEPARRVVIWWRWMIDSRHTSVDMAVHKR